MLTKVAIVGVIADKIKKTKRTQKSFEDSTSSSDMHGITIRSTSITIASLSAMVKTIKVTLTKTNEFTQ
jgi:hypothetical protein